MLNIIYNSLACIRLLTNSLQRMCAHFCSWVVKVLTSVSPLITLPHVISSWLTRSQFWTARGNYYLKHGVIKMKFVSTFFSCSNPHVKQLNRNSFEWDQIFSKSNGFFGKNFILFFKYKIDKNQSSLHSQLVTFCKEQKNKHGAYSLVQKNNHHSN